MNKEGVGGRKKHSQDKAKGERLTGGGWRGEEDLSEMGLRRPVVRSVTK